jgi:hypothetical protein
VSRHFLRSPPEAGSAVTRTASSVPRYCILGGCSAHLQFHRLGWAKPDQLEPCCPSQTIRRTTGERRVPHLVPGTHPCLFTFSCNALHGASIHTQRITTDMDSERGRRVFQPLRLRATRIRNCSSIDLYYRHGSRPLSDHESQRC